MNTYPIKNCPFCGSEGKLIRTSTCMENNEVINHTYKVKCSKCNAETRTCASRIFQDDNGVVHIEANGAIDAIDLWNSRSDV